MTGKVTIDINQRTAGWLGLLWNRLTPTRGSQKVRDILGRLSQKVDMKISVELDGLYLDRTTKITHIPSSEAYAKCLRKAGVLEIDIQKGTRAESIKRILDVLSDRGLKKAKSILAAGSVQVNYTPR